MGIRSAHPKYSDTLFAHSGKATPTESGVALEGRDRSSASTPKRRQYNDDSDGDERTSSCSGAAFSGMMSLFGPIWLSLADTA